jgi:hypothetical protein
MPANEGVLSALSRRKHGFESRMGLKTSANQKVLLSVKTFRLNWKLELQVRIDKLGSLCSSPDSSRLTYASTARLPVSRSSSGNALAQRNSVCSLPSASPSSGASRAEPGAAEAPRVRLARPAEPREAGRVIHHLAASGGHGRALAHTFFLQLAQHAVSRGLGVPARAQADVPVLYPRRVRRLANRQP